MSKLNKLLYILLLIFLGSCKPAGDKFVDAVTDLITKEVTVKTNLEPNLGEISVGSDSKRIVVTIKNNSSDPIRNLKLEIAKNQSVLKFYPNEESAYIDPGYGGTCKGALDVDESCDYVLEFGTRKSGEFEVQVKISYENTIKPEEKIIKFKALLGEPASLVFTNDKTVYNFDVIEKTDPSERILDLEVQNVGGLSAKQLTIDLINELGNEIRLVEHNCPSQLDPLKKCDLKIGYKPADNSYDETEANYSGKLTLGYYKDPEGKTGKLNGVIKYKASTIEAKLTTNFAPIVYGTVVAGNKITKQFKIANSGYKEGELLDFVFKDYVGNVIGTCNKTLPGTSGTKIGCLANTALGFPFELEDLNSCFSKMIKGKSGNLEGDSCYFNLTYWPKKSWPSGSQIINNFDNLSVEIVYDSRFKDLFNQVNKPDMFNISATFSSVAKVELTNVKLNLIDVNPIINSTNGIYDINIGRLAKITDSSYSVNVQLTFSNTGETSAVLVSLTDGAFSPFVVPETTGANLNEYYQGVKFVGCGIIAAGGNCKLSFNLSALDKGNQSTEDALMYDDISDVLKKIKIFNFTYTDGSLFNDDGTNFLNSLTKARLESKLIAKGFLSYVGSTTVTRPSVIHGNSEIFKVKLKNVGTGPIYAILPHTSENFDPDNTASFPFKVTDQVTMGVNDCYDLLYPKNFVPVDGVDLPDSNKFLAAGDSCELAVESKLGDAFRETQATYGTGKVPNHFRHWTPYGDSSEFWMRQDSTTNNKEISFNYYDGDVDPANSASLPFGLKNVSAKYIVTAEFQAPAYVTFRDPKPVQSAILYRPAFTYPNLSMTYPKAITQSSFSVLEDFFDFTIYNSVANSLFYKATMSKNYFSSFVSGPHTTFVYHMGTFKVGEVGKGSISLYNFGGTTASNFVVTEDSAPGSPIALKKLNTLTYTSPSSPYSFSKLQTIPMDFEFTPLTAGETKRCYTFEYNNGIVSNSMQSLCVIANAVNTSPKLKFSVQDYAVTYDSGTDTITETPSGTWIDFNPEINSVDDSLVTNFEAVKASKVYGLKLFKITNIGDSATSGAAFSLLSTENTPGATISDVSVRNAPSGTTCSTNMNLAIGDYCQIFVKYAPPSSPAGSANDLYNFYMGVVYPRISNQYIAQTMKMSFAAKNPAKLAVQSVTPEIVTDWTTPTLPKNISESYPLNLNNYSKSNTHYIHTSASATKTFTVNVVNSNAIKASFLSMNGSPVVGQTWNTILDNSNVKIEANRGCFYGDDEFNGAIPSSEKGFNATTTNSCQLQVSFKASYSYSVCNTSTKTYTVRYGGEVTTGCNPFVFKLNYYSFKRSTQENFYLHVKGYIEPNRSTFSGSQVSNIFAVGTSSSKGSVSFKLPTTFSATDSSLGVITKYRVYYSTSFDELYHKNVSGYYTASPVLNKIDTTSSDITITNLNKGAYYFFKVFMARSYTHPVAGAVTYYSATDLPIFTIPVPDNTAYYSGNLKALVDRSYISTQGTLSQSVSKCASLKYTFTIKGVSKQMTKSLITSTEWNDVITSSDRSTGYPLNDPGSVPHWLNDAAKNIASSITLYDGTTIASFPNFDNTQLVADSSENKLIYQKTCSNNSSCNNLYKIVGGDDVELYFQGTFYTVNTGVAYPRCKATILCPTNAAISITSGSCANP